MVVRDPCGGFRHSKLGIAARHALGAHQAHALAIQVEAVVARLDFADPERGFAGMAVR